MEQIDLDKGEKVPECTSIHGIHNMSNVKSTKTDRVDKCSRCGLEIIQKRDLDYENKEQEQKKTFNGEGYLF